MIKPILAGLPGTTYTPVAIEHAVTLAHTNNAEVTGVTVLDAYRVRSLGGAVPSPWEDADAIRDRRMTNTETRIAQSIREFEATSEAAEIRHRVVEESGDSFTRVVDLTRYQDRMMFGLRSLFKFEQLPDPHNALARLVQTGVRPLLAILKGFYPVKKVLIAYGNLMESAKAMTQCVQMRLWPEAKLRIVTFEYAADKVEQLARNAADYCQAHGFEQEEACVPDAAQAQLPPYPEKWTTDRMVVGNSEKNQLLRRIFGETAPHAIRHTHRPLFLA